MTNILGFQKLKICEPHGHTDVLVVKFDGDYIIGFMPDNPSGFKWVRLKEGPNDFGYAFYDLKKEKYNINWNVGEIQSLDNNSKGKLSLCFIPQENLTPLIVELLDTEDHENWKKIKIKIFEQIAYNFEKEESIIFESTVTYITIGYENGEYFVKSMEDIEG